MGGDVVTVERNPVRTLAVSSSTGVMSLAIGDVADSAISTTAGSDGRGPVGSATVLARFDVPTERRHAEEITPLIQRLLTDTATTPSDLSRLVVDVGPGRFTGLRVGLATVRALAFGLRIPVVPVTCFEVLERGDRSTEVTAVIDARRGEVFQQTLIDGVPFGAPEVGPPEELAGRARGVVVGDGADRYADLYAAAAGGRLTHHLGRHPQAAVMLELSAGRPGRPGTEIEPLYLRGPDAKANIRTRRGEAVAT